MKRNAINHQAQRFSIRKYTFGAASVLIGCVLFLGAQNVSADEQMNQSPVIENTVSSVADNTETANSAPVVADNATKQTDSTTSSTAIKAEEETTSALVSSDNHQANQSQEDAAANVSKEANTSDNAQMVTADTKASEAQAGEKTVSTETAEKTTQTSSPASDTEADLNQEQVSANPVEKQTQTPAIPSQGNYVFQETTPVKNEAKISSPTQFNFNKGDKIFYDKVLEADGYQWLSYVSYSGTRRYAPITAIATVEVLEQNETAQQNLPAQGTYHFTKQVDVKNEAKMSSPTQFSFYNGDQVYYDKVLEADGHQWISYVSYSGTRRYVVLGELATQTVPVETKVTGTIAIQNKTAQQFDVVISNVSSDQGIQKVLVPVWSEQGGQDDLIWYQATKQGDGAYKVTVKVSEHKNNTGNYYVHLYYLLDNGEQRGVGATTTEVEAPKPAETKGIISIANKTSQQFDVLITDASSSQGIKEVLVPVWSEQGGQDDLVWYQASKQGDGVYKVTVKVSDHKNNAGNYNIHLYYRLDNGELKVVKGTTTTVEAPTSNKLNLPAQGTYVFTDKVEVKNAASMSSPTQFTFNKGEKIFYDKVLDAEGYQWISYVSYSGIRRYIPLTTTAATAQNSGASQSTSTNQLPAQGTYRFTKQVGVKNEAKTSSPDVFNFNQGESIYYDSVLNTDGRQWISYRSYSGVRRYIIIN